ncbi:hypothetical protein [Mycobacterium intracellulare]|uniref:hypothetical protein n=1 Tax=Mycobacterium intracellulare TaxID=1767 RepID=UPI00109ED8AE|nr:hypothetical protein [Mycobacterium intracellulare]
MSDENQDDFSYDLVMPFLPVQSKGGPYDDAAFVAGYEMGLLDAQLAGSSFDQGRAIHVANRDQADLLAMRHGYVAEFSDEDVEGWVCMRVHRATADLT